MRKIVFTFPLFFLLVLPAVAKSNNAVGVQNQKVEEANQQQNSGQEVTVQVKDAAVRKVTISPSPSGSQIQNQNQTRTQNKGEESKLEIQNQEEEKAKEGTGSGEGLEVRSQTALEHMSVVAKSVQELLQTRTSGGIGQQVREIAQQQQQAQTQIQEQLKKIDSRGQFIRLLVGTDYGAIKNLQAQLEQNQLRIRQLEQLENQLTNQADKTAVQETIQALSQENTSLQDKIAAEEQTKSLFGWLIRLFVK